MFYHFLLAENKGSIGTQARFNKRPANGHDHSLAVKSVVTNALEALLCNSA
jgi:hypothetical protein